MFIKLDEYRIFKPGFANLFYEYKEFRADLLLLFSITLLFCAVQLSFFAVEIVFKFS